MEVVEITWGRAFLVWWAFFWRVVPILFVGTYLANWLSLNWGYYFIGNSWEAIESYWYFGDSVAVFVATTLFVIKFWILGRDYGSFKLVLMRESSSGNS